MPFILPLPINSIHDLPLKLLVAWHCKMFFLPVSHQKRSVGFFVSAAAGSTAHSSSFLSPLVPAFLSLSLSLSISRACAQLDDYRPPPQLAFVITKERLDHIPGRLVDRTSVSDVYARMTLVDSLSNFYSSVAIESASKLDIFQNCLSAS